ncbi:MAG TPA: M20/M25/M40 family metallo-hydrolase [Bryobacteraceae bacterium]|nr:M20/M25/M40 family metallo-hydrolase [Bryobacteraceae bacterium]
MPALSASAASLAAQPAVRACLDWFRRERAWINEQHLKLCRIPAATFFEQKRAEWMAEQFRALGWEAKIDRGGNTVAHLRGSPDGPRVAMTAHLDTVFAPRTPADIKVAADGRFLGPGVADNGAGLAALLALAAAWTAAPPWESAASPLLVANVGEEGEGNLNGMRYFCRNTKAAKLRAVLVLDGPDAEHITSRALASRRFEVTITGPGGHSWRDYGTANPVHAISRAITLFADRALEETAGEPRTTFNFGIVEGGSSINSIPSEARTKIDLRSEDNARIDQLVEHLTAAVERAVEIENAASTAGRATVRLKEIGSRPSGALPDDAPILECVRAVDAHLGIRSYLDCSSTDANVPLSMGLPAISIGAGGLGGGAHTAAEWYSPEGRELGLQRILLILCMLLGGE